MLKPRYIEQLPEHMVELYSQVEMDILADMAERIAAQNYFIPATQWQYQKLIEMGNFHSYIVEALASRTGMTRQEIERIMEEAGQKALAFDTAVYRRAGLDPPPLAASEGLQRVLQAGIDNTNGLFDNLTRTTTNTATQQLEEALDRAYMQVVTGAFDHNTAVRSEIKGLAQSGVEVIRYPSGHRDYIEVAVRRAMVTGVNQTSLKLQETLAEEMGSDLVEVTAHAGARNTGEGPANHASWQGKVYSRSGTHPKYSSLVEVTGYGTGEGLGGWNCRHNMFPFFEGQESVYTENELEQLNAKDITYNGEKLTEYEASQRQRQIERNMRRWKREYVGMEAAGQPTEEAAGRLAKWQDVQKDFIKQTGLKRQYDRETIPAFGEEQARHARKQSRASESIAIQRQTEYNKKREAVLQQIRSPETPKTLNQGNQNKHIRDSKGYISGRSYIYGNLETAQTLVNQYHGAGEPKLTREGKWTNKEFVSVGYDIGVCIDPETGAEITTNRFSVHYGKKGTHVVPAEREDLS